MLDHLVVDGYNVLYAWGRGRATPMAVARQQLIQELELVAAHRGIRCTIVFDGQPLEDLLHASNDLVTVTFSGPGQSADTVIERLVCGRQQRCGIVVVTDDRAEADLVVGMGAHCWSSATLAGWLTEVRD